jgi:hypothetical protein
MWRVLERYLLTAHANHMEGFPEPHPARTAWQRTIRRADTQDSSRENRIDLWSLRHTSSCHTAARPFFFNLAEQAQGWLRGPKDGDGNTTTARGKFAPQGMHGRQLQAASPSSSAFPTFSATASTSPPASSLCILNGVMLPVGTLVLAYVPALNLLVDAAVVPPCPGQSQEDTCWVIVPEGGSYDFYCSYTTSEPSDMAAYATCNVYDSWWTDSYCWVFTVSTTDIDVVLTSDADSSSPSASLLPSSTHTTLRSKTATHAATRTASSTASRSHTKSATHSHTRSRSRPPTESKTRSHTPAATKTRKAKL